MQAFTQTSSFRVLFSGACLVVIVAGLRAASPFLSPLLLALFLAVLLYPPYHWLLGRGIPTWLAVTLMVAGVMVAGAGILALLWLSLTQLRDNLFLYTNRLVTLRLYVEEILALLGIDAPTLLRQEILGRQFLITTVARLLADFGVLLTTGFFVLVATVFLLLQTTHLAERLRHEFGPDNRLQAQVIQATQRTARFFAIRVRVNLIVAVGITIWLMILGVDLAVLWGILAFFLSFVMYVGLALASIPPVLLALAESGPWWALGVVIGVTVINVSVENVLAPAMMGQGLNLAPVVVMASLVFWAWVLGPLGLILAIPLTIILVMLLASNPETHWLTVLLTMDTPSPTAFTPELGAPTDEPPAPLT